MVPCPMDQWAHVVDGGAGVGGSSSSLNPIAAPSDSPSASNAVLDGLNGTAGGDVGAGGLHPSPVACSSGLSALAGVSRAMGAEV